LTIVKIALFKSFLLFIKKPIFRNYLEQREMKSLKVINVLIFWLLGVNCLYAQQGSVGGMVVDRNTGSPLREAVITSTTGRELTRTAVDGSFTVMLDPGRQMLFVNFPEYEQSVISVLVLAGERIDAGRIEMNVAAGFMADQGTVNTGCPQFHC
jgi:hypothetical protein